MSCGAGNRACNTLDSQVLPELDALRKELDALKKQVKNHIEGVRRDPRNWRG
jgi:hypothetical protein